MGKRMANPPVYFALAQIGFDRFLSIPKYMPEIQEKLRKEGFTTYREEKTSKITISDGEGTTREDVRMVEESLWFLGTKDTQTCVIVAQDGLTLQTSRYTDHADFFQRALAAFDIVAGTLEIDGATEIALRYFNAVIPEEPEKTADFLASEEPKLIAWHEDGLSHFITNSYSVFQTQLEEAGGAQVHGQLVIGTNWFNSVISLPPDIISADMKFDDRFRTDGPVRHVVVDLQHAVQTEAPASNETIRAIFEQLHSRIHSSFQIVFSDTAREKWS